MADNSKKNAANAQFAKVQRDSDAKTAMSEYESTAAALRAKTKRLKALRLARDAAAPPQMPTAPKRKGKKKTPAACRTDWTAKPRKTATGEISSDASPSRSTAT
jgi:hypothetical protein